MTKFTEDAPFMVEGASFWRNSEGRVCYNHSRFDTTALAVAMHAFIEAEREGWHWTNDDHTEARNGRWVAELGTSGVWLMRHDDMPRLSSNLAWSHGADMPWHSWIDKNLRDDFLAWITHSQPEEPTEPEPTPERSPNHVATIELRLDAAGLADDIERVVAAIRGVLDQPEVDPLAHVTKGDADPTPDSGHFCGAKSDDGFGCTREPRHPGQHIAGDGSRVLAIWPQELAS